MTLRVFCCFLAISYRDTLFNMASSLNACVKKSLPTDNVVFNKIFADNYSIITQHLLSEPGSNSSPSEEEFASVEEQQ